MVLRSRPVWFAEFSSHTRRRDLLFCVTITPVASSQAISSQDVIKKYKMTSLNVTFCSYTVPMFSNGSEFYKMSRKWSYNVGKGAMIETCGGSIEARINDIPSVWLPLMSKIVWP